MLIHHANLWVCHTVANKAKARVSQWLLPAPTHILNFKLRHYCNSETMCVSVQLCRQEKGQAGIVSFLSSLRSVSNCGNLTQICSPNPHKGQATIQRHSQNIFSFGERLKKCYPSYQILQILQYCTISYLSSFTLAFIDVISVATIKS